MKKFSVYRSGLRQEVSARIRRVSYNNKFAIRAYLPDGTFAEVWEDTLTGRDYPFPRGLSELPAVDEWKVIYRLGGPLRAYLNQCGVPYVTDGEKVWPVCFLPLPWAEAELEISREVVF